MPSDRDDLTQELPAFRCVGKLLDGSNCPCRQYRGSGGPCETEFVLLVGDVPPTITCGHRPDQHLEN
jgi:Family of unknown function (DUF6422)